MLARRRMWVSRWDRVSRTALHLFGFTSMMNLRAETALVVPSTFMVTEQTACAFLLAWVRLSSTVGRMPLQGLYHGWRGRLWVSERHLEKGKKSWSPKVKWELEWQNDLLNTDKINCRINCVRSLLEVERWVISHGGCWSYTGRVRYDPFPQRIYELIRRIKSNPQETDNSMRRCGMMLKWREKSRRGLAWLTGGF